MQGKGWIEAKDIEWEDPIATIDGDVIAYQNDYIDTPTRVYNFTVGNTHNYFAGGLGAWVHNAGSGPGCSLAYQAVFGNISKVNLQHLRRHAKDVKNPVKRAGGKPPSKLKDVKEYLADVFETGIKKEGTYLGSDVIFSRKGDVMLVTKRDGSYITNLDMDKGGIIQRDWENATPIN